jgi:hypothetical protein
MSAILSPAFARLLAGVTVSAHGSQQMQMLLDVGAAEDAPAQLGAILGSLLRTEQRIRRDQAAQRVSADGHTSTHELQVAPDAA